MRKQVHGATMQHITKGKFDNLQIPLPPLATQKRIAEILDAADALRRKDQELLKKYDELAQAIFIDMFGDNTNVVKLNEITTKITDGVHAKPNYQEEGVPFLSVKNVTNKYLDFDNCKYISLADHNAYTKRCMPEFEDILYTKVGATYGRSAIIDSHIEFSIYVSLALIKPNKRKVYPLYLNFVLNTNYVKKQADKRVKGAGVPDLHLVEIKDFDIPLPSYEAQLEFSNVIGNLNKNINSIKQQLEKSNCLFNSLIQKAFKGELVS
jgi:type I restriction enzyme S subunit